MRYQKYLRERYRALLSYVGGILLVMGVLLLTPLLVLVFYPDEVRYIGGFLLGALPLISGGALLWRFFAPKEELSVTVQEGMVVVLIVWVVTILVSAIPLMTAAELDFAQAVFESTSGWTTTGLSVVDVLAAPQIVLFYRSLIQLIGGAGIVIITLTTITGAFGVGLSLAEGHNENLAPHVRSSAVIVLRIYIAYVVIGILALRIAGMGWFDAINHAFTAVATGGFSTRPESIGYWNNGWIEAIIIVLMILGATNFLTAYTLFRGNLFAFVRNAEIRLAALVLPISIVLLAIFTVSLLESNWIRAAQLAAFEAASALTGAGLNVAIHANLNPFGWLILVLLMMIGGASGSTAGGIKQYRIYVMYKALRWEYQRAFLPAHAVNEPVFWRGENQVFLNDRLVRQVSLFVFLYFLVLMTGTAIVTLHGYGLGESLYEFASALGTVGLSVGIVTPNTPDSLLWVFTAGMFLGRLEFFAVSIGLTKIVIDLYNMRAGAAETKRKRN